MTDPKDVSKLLQTLHEQKLINLDVSIRSVLEPVDGLSRLDPNSVASAVIAWDGYGLVIKGKAPDLADVQTLANSITNAMRSSR